MSSRRRNKKRNRTGRICISCIVFMFLIVMSIQIVKLYQKNQGYTTEAAGLQEQLEEETQRADDLKDYEEYTKSQEYVEDVAKSKLGLVHDNVIVFKEDEDAQNP